VKSTSLETGAFEKRTNKDTKTANGKRATFVWKIYQKKGMRAKRDRFQDIKRDMKTS